MKDQEAQAPALLDDGGPAFPETEQRFERDGDVIDRYSVSKPGMTLRDYFAAKALPAIIEANKENAKISFEGEAKEAYKYADAMLKIRSEGRS